ncbi:MAG: protein kinase domain-containing protein [Anaerolineae bacterium]
MADLSGQILRERYQIQHLIGRGGMADVYLALDLRRQVVVALKLLREDLAEDPDFVRRFQREAEALARLDHPNVVRFYSFERQGNAAFIVMDYVPGTTLRGRLMEAQGPLPLEEVTAIIKQVGAALHYAHSEGYIHRDIKPGNIMLREDGTALLSDFGIAKAAETATMTLAPLGTPAYMSPEQILGREVSPQTDIYCFGVVLYEIVTGRRPFIGESGTGGSTTERIRNEHLHAMPPDPRRFNPSLPAEAVQVIARALAKDPAQRWPDMPSLVQAWGEAVGLPVGSVTTRPTPSMTQPTAAQAAMTARKTVVTGQPGVPYSAPLRQRPAWLIWAIPLALVALLGGAVICVAVAIKLFSPSAMPTVVVAMALTATSTAIRETPSDTPTPTATVTVLTDTPKLAPSSEIHLRADGSGDYPSLAEAVQAAPEGATIYLEAGSYKLARPVDIERRLKLVGAGKEQTEIICAAENYVLRVARGTSFIAEDIAFRHEGRAIANVVIVEGGESEFNRCLFQGGIWDKEAQNGGSGILLRGNAVVTVRDSFAQGNGLYGIEAVGSAKVTLVGNICSDNEGGGISFWGRATGVARKNNCSGNGYHGIAVNERADPILAENTCDKNQYDGIGYFGDGTGKAIGNECSGNGYHGIAVNERAHPTLESNYCHDNEDSGISYFDDGGGTANNNECSGNKLHGIAVSNQAKPMLENNNCHDNKDSGISFFDGAAGSASNNQCYNNSLHGIAVSDKAQPILEGNICSNNQDTGIAYFDGAGGSASGNECFENVSYGIYVSPDANPQLGDNYLHDNGLGDLEDQRQ